MQHLFILLPSVVTPEFGILAINSDLFWKNGWRSLLYFRSTFKISSLACSLSLSISFCTSSTCSIAFCCSFSEVSWAPSRLELSSFLLTLAAAPTWCRVRGRAGSGEGERREGEEGGHGFLSRPTRGRSLGPAASSRRSQNIKEFLTKSSYPWSLSFLRESFLTLFLVTVTLITSISLLLFIDLPFVDIVNFLLWDKLVHIPHHSYFSPSVLLCS